MGDEEEFCVVPKDETALRELAVKRLKEKRDFKTHLVVYVLVNTLIFVIWLVTALVGGAWFPWFLFPLCGWGIGLGMHAWPVYGGKDVTDEQVGREMEKLRGGLNGLGGGAGSHRGVSRGRPPGSCASAPHRSR